MSSIPILFVIQVPSGLRLLLNNVVERIPSHGNWRASVSSDPAASLIGVIVYALSVSEEVYP